MSEAKDPDGTRPDHASPKDTELERRLHDLDRRLDQSRAARKVEVGPAPPKRPGMAMAMRLGADFVAGVVLGAALGWGFDRLFGTTPWGMMVFLLLGFAAGVLSVLRSAGLVAKKSGIDDPISKKFDG